MCEEPLGRQQQCPKWHSLSLQLQRQSGERFNPCTPSLPVPSTFPRTCLLIRARGHWPTSPWQLRLYCGNVAHRALSCRSVFLFAIAQSACVHHCVLYCYLSVLKLAIECACERKNFACSATNLL
jgi:hypothetical protein